MDTQISNGSFHGKISACFNQGGGDSVVTWGHLSQIMETVIDGFQSQARKHNAEIAELRGEIARLKSELDRKIPTKYLGTYRQDATYTEGSLVTRDGSIFHANKTTRETPGDGCMDWTLAVKRGRDGRDAVKS